MTRIAKTVLMTPAFLVVGAIALLCAALSYGVGALNLAMLSLNDKQ